MGQFITLIVPLALLIMFVYALLLLAFAIAKYSGFLVSVSNDQNLLSKTFSYVFLNTALTTMAHKRLMVSAVVLSIAILGVSLLIGLINA